MARARSERTRSKTPAIDDITQSIEQLQAFIPKLEDLGREGFPYLEGALARTELQLRECIKRAFGDKSSEFQTHRQHKLSVSSLGEAKRSVTLIRTLIASLENKKLELQGLKPAIALDVAPAPTPSQMALVPPVTSTAQLSVTSVTATRDRTSTTLHLVPSAEKPPLASPAASAPEALMPRTAVAEPSPAVATPLKEIPPRTAIEPISSLFRTQETKPLGPPAEPAPAALVSAPPPSANPALPTAAAPLPYPESLPAAAPPPHAPASPPAPAPSIASSGSPSGAPPPQSLPAACSTTQDVGVPVAPSVPTSSHPSLIPAVGASAAADTDGLSVTKRLCQRFHAVARQLRLRGEYRSTLSIEDEFDVQDLIHALLRQYFDDIGTDEWTPAYSDGAPRTTFLLDHDRLAVVVKKTRPGLSRKDLADQLHADGERYRGRGRCTQLLCFIYDPEGRIGNPRGLESELTSTSEHFTVDVVVAPK
jgi:hypothetical protein